MASVDGKKSCQFGSDEVFQRTCGPCKEDGDDNEASYYCDICSEFLCTPCKDEHKKFKATKNHKIYSVGLMPRKEPLALNLTSADTCSCSQNLALEFYCDNHAEVMCRSCEAIKHRKCTTSSLQDKLLNYSTDHFKSVLEKTKVLKSKMEKLIRDREENVQKLEKMKEECRRDIGNFRQGFRNILDKMQEDMVNVMEEKAKQQHLSFERQISTISLAMQAINADEELLQNANKTCTEAAMFVADIKTAKNLQEYDEMTHDVEKNFQTPQLRFQKSVKLADFLTNIGSLGEIASIETIRGQKDKTIILHMKVKSSTKIDIRLPEDTKTPNITGSAIFPNGYIVLCDRANGSVKLVDNDWVVKESLRLSYMPWNIAIAHEYMAVVNFNFNVKKIQFINVFPKLKVVNEIVLNEKCLGIDTFDGDIYTVYRKGSGEKGIWRLDQSGNIKSKICLAASTLAYYLSIFTSEKKPHVYYFTNCTTLTCARHDGTTVFQYKDKGLERANGLYVDSEGNCLVCGTDSNNIVIITADGKKYRELLTSEDNLKEPKSICFRKEDDTLIVCCENNSYLHIYKFATEA